MKIQEGPAFGALIIGCGVGYLTHTKTHNMPLAIFLGLAVAVADYVLVLVIKRVTKK